jgi:mannose-6-phosphate isomerase-like protein (cupin superfamily)
MHAAAGAGTLSRPDLENWTMRVIDSRVLNIDELKLEHFTQGDTFEGSCPFHSHRGEEEMFFILKGNGTLRYGDETRKIRAGDVICCPWRSASTDEA